MLAPLGRIQDIAEPLPGSKEGSFPGSRTINIYFTSLSLQIGKVIPFTFVFLDPLFERFPSYIQILAVRYLPFHCFSKVHLQIQLWCSESGLKLVFSPFLLILNFFISDFFRNYFKFSDNQ